MKSSYSRSKSQTVMAVNTTTSTYSRTTTPPTYSTLPSLANPACKICLEQQYTTLDQPLSPREAPISVAAIRADDVNNHGHRPRDSHTSTSTLKTAATDMSTVIDVHRCLRAETQKFYSLPVTPHPCLKAKSQGIGAGHFQKHSACPTSTHFAASSLRNDVSVSTATGEMALNYSNNNQPNNKQRITYFLFSTITPQMRTSR